MCGTIFLFHVDLPFADLFSIVSMLLCSSYMLCHCETCIPAIVYVPALSLDINPVLFVLDLHMKYTMEVVPIHMYIVWFVIV